MNSTFLKRIISISIAVALTCICVPLTPLVAEEVPEGSHASQGVPEETEATSTGDGSQTSDNARIKEEVVYATLESDGSINDAYVVNRFDETRDSTIIDYGAYREVTNLTNSEQLTASSGKVSIPDTDTSFFYQGTLDNAELPWTFDLTYYLDGRQVTAEDIAGATGTVGLNLIVHQNETSNKVFTDNYMLQVSFTLSGDSCTNVVSDNGTMAVSGKDRVISHTILPGKEADILVTTTAKGFEMGGIQISAIPYSMSFGDFDTDEMVEEMGSLSDAIDSLNEGIGKLEQGAQDLSSGAIALKDGSARYADGMTTISAGSANLRYGSSQILAALQVIEESLSSGGTADGNFDISDLIDLPDGLRAIGGGIDQTTAGLAQMRDSYSSMFAALDGALSTIPANEIAASDLAALHAAATGDAEQRALTQLLAYYQAGRTVYATYYGIDPLTGMTLRDGLSHMTAGYTTIIESLDTIKGSLDYTAQMIEDGLDDIDITAQLTQLAAGMSELAQQYRTFDAGLTQYTEGVDTLSTNYTSLHAGLASLSDGIETFTSGVSELHAGSSELNDAVADLPDETKKQIDDAMAEFLSKDFDPVSFVSDKNDAMIARVQFVMVTEAISAPEAEEEETPVEDSEGLFDRVIALFG